MQYYTTLTTKNKSLKNKDYFLGGVAKKNLSHKLKLLKFLTIHTDGLTPSVFFYLIERNNKNV